MNSENSILFESETSSVKDASVILYHPVTKDEYSGITKKLKKSEEILTKTIKDYDSYERSIKVLQAGIKATKFNYSD